MVDGSAGFPWHVCYSLTGKTDEARQPSGSKSVGLPPGSMIDSLTKVTASSLLAYAKTDRMGLSEKHKLSWTPNGTWDTAQEAIWKLVWFLQGGGHVRLQGWPNQMLPSLKQELAQVRHGFATIQSRNVNQQSTWIFWCTSFPASYSNFVSIFERDSIAQKTKQLKISIKSCYWLLSWLHIPRPMAKHQKQTAWWMYAS